MGGANGGKLCVTFGARIDRADNDETRRGIGSGILIGKRGSELRKSKLA
jgi:hypothetical protein